MQTVLSASFYERTLLWTLALMSAYFLSAGFFKRWLFWALAFCNTQFRNVVDNFNIVTL